MEWPDFSCFAKEAQTVIWSQIVPSPKMSMRVIWYIQFNGIYNDHRQMNSVWVWVDIAGVRKFKLWPSDSAFSPVCGAVWRANSYKIWCKRFVFIFRIQQPLLYCLKDQLDCAIFPLSKKSYIIKVTHFRGRGWDRGQRYVTHN